MRQRAFHAHRVAQDVGFARSAEGDDILALLARVETLETAAANYRAVVSEPSTTVEAEHAAWLERWREAEAALDAALAGGAG